MKFEIEKVFGFTMAEVLVTLGLVGVVAAMTLPSVITKIEDQVVVARLKKIYSILTISYQSHIVLEGDPTSWALGDVSDYSTSEDYANSAGLARIFENKIQSALVCGSKKGCFADGYYKFTNGTEWRDSLDEKTHRYKMVTNDGVSVAYHWYAGKCDKQEKNLKICGMVFVDVDGPKSGPATWGKDLFRFMLTKNNVVPDGDVMHAGSDFSKSECPKQGTQCAAWVIYNENRDYLRCKNLKWYSKTKCQ